MPNFMTMTDYERNQRYGSYYAPTGKTGSLDRFQTFGSGGAGFERYSRMHANAYWNPQSTHNWSANVGGAPHQRQMYGGFRNQRTGRGFGASYHATQGSRGSGGSSGFAYGGRSLYSMDGRSGSAAGSMVGSVPGGGGRGLFNYTMSGGRSAGGSAASTVSGRSQWNAGGGWNSWFGGATRSQVGSVSGMSSRGGSDWGGGSQYGYMRR